MGIWQKCMDEITTCGGAVYSNKALRKYFKLYHCNDSRNKSYIDLADIYGQVVSQGLYFEKLDKLQEDNSFYSSADFIGEQLGIPTRRVWELTDILHEQMILAKIIVPGKPHSYRATPGVLPEICKCVDLKKQG